jgi:hypothetical protein
VEAFGVCQCDIESTILFHCSLALLAYPEMGLDRLFPIGGMAIQVNLDILVAQVLCHTISS